MTNRPKMTGSLVCCFITILILIAPTNSGASQDTSGGHFATFKQLLRERNVSLTGEALVAALRNTDPQVRYLAALVLAEDKETNAIPAIADALATEKVPETRVNMALALAQLGDENGIAALRDDCSNSELAPSLRMYAAKYLLDLHSEGCLNSIEDVARSAKDPGARILALSQLARFQHASEADSDKIIRSLATGLSEKEPMVMIAASHGLSAFGSLAGIPYLQRAIAAEHDRTVRSIMQADLQGLQQKAGH
jgi:HEAT repeat protein